MSHYLLYELPIEIITLHDSIANENPGLVLLLYCIIVLWLILLFSRH
ncbi:hypothetical protein GYRE_02511 [Yokenella regensburgei ATCC 49455]|uniref:Uncharacterized protein n=1 Tax=Yokenella regensburgei TaxID=158877 RepID=A0AB38G294_9ENTR|nr:hypothetical protein GYRE_02511 [Yokenella regensburgei ATCC 49455]SQA65315.1 Uncharacterised protein [Yokenella regensburgei]SQA95766.1 Uncharacterised protein [Yokenella regensburgei]SUQ03891.1 Uncharacterised protein [Yokenella regensburgei]